MEYTRNNDPEYYIRNQYSSNCGSFALRLKEWYDPEDYLHEVVDDIYDWIYELSEEGYSEYEIACMYADTLIDGILIDFDGELELCDGRPPTTSDIELIAFNTWCCAEDGDINRDFHFKVFRDGHWMEKNGVHEVHECEEDDWGKYNGDPYYMYHRIGDVA